MRASELGDPRGAFFLPALPVHQEGVDECQKSDERQHHIHLEGEKAVRRSPPLVEGPEFCLVYPLLSTQTQWCPLGWTLGYFPFCPMQQGWWGVGEYYIMPFILAAPRGMWDLSSLTRD